MLKRYESDDSGAHLEPRRPAPDPGGGQLERRHPDAAVRGRAASVAALRLLLLHDDGDREFAYTAEADAALDAAGTKGWTVVSMAGYWTRVFADDDGA